MAAFQESAFANLRRAVGNVPLIFGAVSAYLLMSGEVDPPQLAPHAVCVLAGLLAVGDLVFDQRRRWGIAPLVIAWSALVIGLVGLVLTR
ncbi:MULTISPECIES: hypothetical protein [Micromonospora]|uniref:Uncharacterized protein n=1 Tax=Micromonospora sicca TaxID=2202420 RepID=A0A317DC11_9ACTN|nr:hypothetical protein [Micromonospora sp. 4G51]PWR10195.1 hypothetical protein DKT69_29550 [Micromonospora sp. 4G51]